LGNYTPARKKLEDAVAERTKLLGGSEQIKNLAKIVDGDNPFRQPLDTFVLQSMFRQVLAAGNLRFQNLLEGRYSFELDEVGSDKRLTQGLGLSVRDRNTGETRNTKTLSGGEAFCASLSLALGLSDIVRAESGGLAIDTFFIDEGFGSLDGERLNQVNNMLSRLQAEGRTIGLISHVTEMKESINEKIDVKPSKTGGPSTLKVNWMSASV
jgi:exonuclease SbcC